ncbi:hypothetical protein [Pseudofrankia inefficax]|uniref:Uncharacterized protein n=1 Tax=Pseudofrankia inefficax (strain DSM 45817 / CECT 9037 / DDB 130130 / EuI1c) TaxID=298654 RepID=E3IZ81_PSEI1|nr:hypothetical protein [Pseudofrankia inefficax]ADP81508.1 hypothetical protein FraEuI1c_3499 [Pseudofrankia inefficax]
MFPVTPAAEAALAVATRFCSPALVNHSVRSYLWGARYGTAHGIAFDEAHLLQVATSWEVVGPRPREFPPDARAQVLARYPRLGFGTEFVACFEDQARRKPGSAAAASVRKNVAGRIAANPLEGRPPTP